MTTYTYPSKVLIPANGRYIYAQVRKSMNGTLSLYIGDKAAKDCGKSLSAPEPFGPFCSFHDERGMRALPGNAPFDDVISALRKMACRGSRWLPIA